MKNNNFVTAAFLRKGYRKYEQWVTFPPPGTPPPACATGKLFLGDVSRFTFSQLAAVPGEIKINER
jgi:hypothetical protein